MVNVGEQRIAHAEAKSRGKSFRHDHEDREEGGLEEQVRALVEFVNAGSEGVDLHTEPEAQGAHHGSRSKAVNEGVEDAERSEGEVGSRDDELNERLEEAQCSVLVLRRMIACLLEASEKAIEEREMLLGVREDRRAEREDEAVDGLAEGLNSPEGDERSPPGIVAEFVTKAVKALRIQLLLWALQEVNEPGGGLVRVLAPVGVLAREEGGLLLEGVDGLEVGRVRSEVRVLLFDGVLRSELSQDTVEVDLWRGEERWKDRSYRSYRRKSWEAHGQSDLAGKGWSVLGRLDGEGDLPLRSICVFEQGNLAAAAASVEER